MNLCQCRLVVLLWLAGLVYLSGCDLTVSTWESADTKNLEFKTISGCTVDRSGPTTRISAVVAEYTHRTTHWTERYHVLIPLDSDGAPAAPFGLRGSPRNFRELPQLVTQDQRTAVTAAFGTKDYARGREAMMSDTYIPANSQPEGIERAAFASFVGEEVAARWIWPATDHRAKATTRPLLPPPFYFPASFQVVLLPRYLPRKEGDRNASLCMAALTTPINMVIDTFYINPAMFWIYMQMR